MRRAEKMRKKEEEEDEYDRTIENLIGNQEKVGLAIAEEFWKDVHSVLDEKVAKDKRDLFPQPENLTNLRVLRLNNVTG